MAMSEISGHTSKSEALDSYAGYTKRKLLTLITLVVLIVLVGSFAVTLGPLEITVLEVYTVIFAKLLPGVFQAPSELAEGSIWFIRLPRLLMGLAAGFSLAIAGAAMQPALRNPLASPFTLGISAGAGFGAALAIVLGRGFFEGTYFVVANAFVFALFTSLVVMMLAKYKGITPETMILAGIALNYLFGAATTLIQYFAVDSWAVREVVFWLVGSLAKATWGNLAIIMPILLLCIPFLFLKAWDLNVMSAGDDTAKSLGINVGRVRMMIIVAASLLTATVICFTGTIGFIGLVAPHITRMIIGGDNRFAIPAAGLMGALLLTGADMVAVNIIAPTVIPIGVMTSFMGVPLFIYLIVKRRKEM